MFLNKAVKQVQAVLSVFKAESICSSKPVGKSDYVLERSCEASSSCLALHCNYGDRNGNWRFLSRSS